MLFWLMTRLFLSHTHTTSARQAGSLFPLATFAFTSPPHTSHACVVQAIERILTTYITNVKASTPLAWVFPAVDGSSVVPSEQEPPSTLLWLLLLASKVRTVLSARGNPFVHSLPSSSPPLLHGTPTHSPTIHAHTRRWAPLPPPPLPDPSVGTTPLAVQAHPLLLLLHLPQQHFDRLGNFSHALALIDEAVEHTPTVVELYMFKARVLKHLCRLSDAAACMNTARTMDLADRYINTCVGRGCHAPVMREALVACPLNWLGCVWDFFCLRGCVRVLCGSCSKTVKYKLRDGHIEDGLATYLLFAKVGPSSYPSVPPLLVHLPASTCASNHRGPTLFCWAWR
jgi:hypothetical protein